jgi:hypothetical protein
MNEYRKCLLLVVLPASISLAQPQGNAGGAQDPNPLTNAAQGTYHGVVVSAQTVSNGQPAGRTIPVGCRFHFHLRAGEAAMEARQISAVRFNSGSDCEADFQVGVPTKIQPPLPEPPALQPGQDAGNGISILPDSPPVLPRKARHRADGVIGLPQGRRTPTPNASGARPHDLCSPPIDCQAPYQFAAGGQVYAYIRDPVYITVNSVTTTVRYYTSDYWQDGCANAGAGWDSTYAAPTGWAAYNNQQDWGYVCEAGPDGYIGQNYTYAVDWVDFVNAAFCPILLGGGVTYADYFPQELIGNSDGSLDAWSTMSVSGGCTRLLTPMNIQITRIY